SFLDAFVEASDSPYGCLLANGRVVVATSKWWELSSTELVLLSLLMQSVPQCTSRDIPIYLPQASPSVPHRLMTFELIKNVDVCVICGPSPTLAQLSREISRFWTPAIETLKSTRQLNLRNFPLTLDMDSNVMG
ncbi:protein fuzzy, partial [Biomphalaria glabrata]